MELRVFFFTLKTEMKMRNPVLIEPNPVSFIFISVFSSSLFKSHRLCDGFIIL